MILIRSDPIELGASLGLKDASQAVRLKINLETTKFISPANINIFSVDYDDFKWVYLGTPDLEMPS